MYYYRDKSVTIRPLEEEDCAAFARAFAAQGWNLSLIHIFAGALQLVGKLAEFLGGDGVEHDVGAGDGDGRAQGAEFEFIPRKGEGGGAVAVGGVHVQVGQHVDAGLQGLSLIHI